MQNSSTSLVILGATGDLARRKLLPGLFQLVCKGMLPANFRVVGMARSQYSDDRFREMMWQEVQELSGLAARKKDWNNFARHLHYVRGDLQDLESFMGLRARLEELETETPSAHRLFYLSVAPSLFPAAVENLGYAGLAVENTGWRRVVIEKPFGHDLNSAEQLDRLVHQVFKEEQVYRIDHYLGKETVLNLMVFRFANAIFEPLWNRNYVDSVQISATEEVSAEDRAGYYDQSGVIRDMVQNHLLQLLTLVAMEPPSAMDADSLRNNKVEALRAIRRWDMAQAAQNSVLGQYRGYLDEAGVAPDSRTATYAALRLYIDNWRWQGVPFYLRTGKSMKEKVTEIVIQFRQPPHLMFAGETGETLSSNVLSLRLQPNEGVHIKFEVKAPGQGMSTRSEDLEFHYGTAFEEQTIPEAYERLLQDALEGDTSLFIRNDHILEAWRIVEPLIKESEGAEAGSVQPYDAGSWGPAASKGLLSRQGHTWQETTGSH